MRCLVDVFVFIKFSPLLAFSLVIANATVVPTLPLVLGTGLYSVVVGVTVHIIIGIARVYRKRETFTDLGVTCHLGLRDARNELAQRRGKVVRGDDDSDLLGRRHLGEVVLWRERGRPLLRGR